MDTPIDDMTYAQCLNQLEQILRAMQGDNCDIDHLTAYTRRAAALIAACRKRLTTTEEELKTILAQLQ